MYNYPLVQCHQKAWPGCPEEAGICGGHTYNFSIVSAANTTIVPTAGNTAASASAVEWGPAVLQ